jgi:hypothetical protein
MVKNQDIVLIIELFSSSKASLEQQREFFEEYYSRSKTCVMLKMFELISKHGKAEAIAGMLHIVSTPRLVVYNRNLISRNKSLLKLFRKHGSYAAIRGTRITKQWLDERIAKMHEIDRARKALAALTPKPVREPKVKQVVVDRFGLPCISQRVKKGLVDMSLIKRLERQRKRKEKKAAARAAEIASNTEKLEAYKEKFRAPNYLDYYGAVTFYAPIEKLLTDKEVLAEANKFYFSSRLAKAILLKPEIHRKVLLYNCPEIPNKVNQEFRRIIREDNKKKYARKNKRKRPGNPKKVRGSV